MKRFLRASLIQTAAALHLDEAMLGRLRGRARRGGPLVVVVAMHETLQRDAERLRRQLQWVADRFTIISPETFFGLWDRAPTPSNWPQPAVLFTFDDGRASNYTVAAPMLESMGSRGLFFVVPEFVGLDGDKAREFYHSSIDVRGTTPAGSEEEWRPVNAEQLFDLVRRGHAVGNHTLSHVSLGNLSLSELRRQVVGGAEKILSWTQQPVDAFAWPYAWNAMTRQAWDLIRQTHRFCFSPCPGMTDCSSDCRHLIWRTEIEAYYSEPEYRFMYSGMANPVWAGKRRRLRAMLKA